MEVLVDESHEEFVHARPHQLLRGSLIHRAVLHPGGEWFAVGNDNERQQYIEHAKSFARSINGALFHDDLEMVKRVIAPGGPAWGDDWVDGSTSLKDPHDRAHVYADIETVAVATAKELMRVAALNDWEYARTEMKNPSTSSTKSATV